MRNEKGITLVALVVTIIVLLILAGVSLNLMLGNDGIMNKTISAVEKTNEASAKEQVSLKIAEFQTEYYEKKYKEHTIEADKQVGDWIFETYGETENSTTDYVFTIDMASESGKNEEEKYLVVLQESGGLKTEITGYLSTLGKLKWNRTTGQENINSKASESLKKLLAVGNLKMTLEDVLNSAQMAQKIIENQAIQEYFDVTTVEDKANILKGDKTLEEVLEMAQIEEVTIADIATSERLLNKLLSNEKVLNYLREEENRAVLKELVSNEVAKQMLKEKDKNLFYELARVELTLVPSANNTGTVEVLNGEYTLTGNAKLESEEIMNLTTFTFYAEVKNLTRYYNGIVAGDYPTYTSLILGTGEIHSSHSYYCTGILDGWCGNVISYSSGSGQCKTVSRDCLVDDWNRLAVTYDGNVLKMYVNGVEKASCNSANCIQTKFFVGGHSNAPNYEGGTNNGYSNGTYRNIRVYDVALDAESL